MTYLYTIKNVDCSACAAMMEEALLSQKGITSASIDMDKKHLRLEGEKLDPLFIQTLLQKTDSDVEVLEIKSAEEDEHAGHSHGEEDEAHYRKERLLLGVSSILFILGLIFGEWINNAAITYGLKALYLVLYLTCGIPVLKKGFSSIIKGDFFNEFTLMGFASLTAIGLGDIAEAAGVMLFYSIGELFQERAAQKSRQSIKSLLAQKPSSATVLRNGVATEIAPEEVQKGDVILVKPGQKIPVDGVILSGNSRIDTSSLTGESVPVAANAGAAVFGGTVNLEGTLRVEASGSYRDSSVARILEMVENAVARKSKTERFITRFARVYTPAVVAIAALVAFVPPLMGVGSLRDWGYRALVLLVISCPCALVISVPLGYFGGIGAASKRGILVKGGNVFDALKTVRSVFFDKTGTLTHGVFEVTKTVPAESVSRESLIHAAALAEGLSNHPIARSIQKAFGTPPQTESLHITEVPGQGLSMPLEKGMLLAGNSTLLQNNGITNFHEVEGSATVVHIAENGQYLGHIELSDIIREDAKEAVLRLRALGITRIGMLSGDRENIAKEVAQTLGLDVYRAELLPDEKVRAMEELTEQEPGGTLFVGDGVNDAPVLAAASVGVAMGGLGSEVAVEVADAVILDDSPLKVAELLSIAHKTRRIVQQNIVLALGTKGVFMLLGVIGVAGLWEAIFADVGVALLAVLNARRTMH